MNKSKNRRPVCFGDFILAMLIVVPMLAAYTRMEVYAQAFASLLVAYFFYIAGVIRWKDVRWYAD